MQIKTAEFVMSNTDVGKCPNTGLPEYAFIGRSNVGKSSLINMLTDHKKLAKISGTPGKTQLINHFLINNSWHLVDLPGYGYAKVSKSAKKTFQKLITNYFLKRQQLTDSFILVDIRHEPQAIDLEFMTWMGEQQLPFNLVFTKADKLKPTQQAAKVAAYLDRLMAYWEEPPNHFITSSSAKTGKDPILDYIHQTNMEINQLRERLP